MKTEKKDFVKVPWIFWKSVSTKMDYIEGYIFLYLAQYCYGSKTECYPTQQTISIHTGIPLVTVKRKIKSMVQREILRIVKTSRSDKPKWNTYQLTEWDQIPFCPDWFDTEKINKSDISSKDTLHGITETPSKVSQRDIKKINTRRLIQEDKFVAEATSSSEEINTTVSSGNRGEAPMYETNDTNSMNTNSVSSAALGASSDYDAMMANKRFVARLNNGILSEVEHDAFIAACEAKEIAEEQDQERKEKERRKKLTINQLIEEDVNPSLTFLPSDIDNTSLLNAIWNHFKNKTDSFKYKRSLFSIKFDDETFIDPINHDELSIKEVLIRTRAMLDYYWTPEHWYGDGSLMMFIMNFKSFYSDIVWLRWTRLEDYCRENSHFLAKKCIKENGLLSLSNNQPEIKEILDSGFGLTDLQYDYLTSDPNSLKYNCVGVITTDRCMVRDYERPEISLETFNAIYTKITKSKAT